MAHLTKWLRGQVVLAFRSNLTCFWEIWSVVSSTPRSGRWFFFSVQINYYKLFLYAYIFYNDKKQSKVLSNLSKITLNFWTVCTIQVKEVICLAFPDTTQVLRHHRGPTSEKRFCSRTIGISYGTDWKK